jgi:hypothetical protein
MNLKFKLTEDKILDFKQHINFKDSISAILKLDNGYNASIITRKPFNDNLSVFDSAQGSWNDETFELAILDEKESFIQIDELYRDDEEYRFNYGVWPNLSKNDLLEKIQMISSLKGN